MWEPGFISENRPPAARRRKRYTRPRDASGGRRAGRIVPGPRQRYGPRRGFRPRIARLRDPSRPCEPRAGWPAYGEATEDRSASVKRYRRTASSSATRAGRTCRSISVWRPAPVNSARVYARVRGACQTGRAWAASSMCSVGARFTARIRNSCTTPGRPGVGRRTVIRGSLPASGSSRKTAKRSRLYPKSRSSPQVAGTRIIGPARPRPASACATIPN
jgi:hypothetical protein